MSMKGLPQKGNGVVKNKTICDENSERTLNCPSNQILWTEDNQFWLPNLHVEDALELVLIKSEFKQFRIMC